MSKINNPKVEVPSGKNLNEKDYCTCLLNTLKEMSKNYCTAMTEASNDWLFDIYREVFLDLVDLQRDLYSLMFKNGWYVLEEVSQTKLDEKLQTLDTEYQALSK